MIQRKVFVQNLASFAVVACLWQSGERTCFVFDIKYIANYLYELCGKQLFGLNHELPEGHGTRFCRSGAGPAKTLGETCHSCGVGDKAGIVIFK